MPSAARGRLARFTYAPTLSSPSGNTCKYTKAAVFQPGTKTDTLVRFSSVAGESGSPDTWRDPRGFALKFYTREGNYDMVGNNTPAFFVRDPMKFQHFIRTTTTSSRPAPWYGRSWTPPHVTGWCPTSSGT